MNSIKQQREDAVRALLSTIPKEYSMREGLVGTPDRVARMYDELFGGYEVDIEKLFKARFTTDNDSMVIVKDIEYFSNCEHHILPFFGKVHIAYIPNGKVLGLSKFGRLVEAYSRRLQIQEQMTEQIANDIQKHLNPKGLAVIVTGKHLCMVMRGIKKQDSVTVTSSVKGILKENSVARGEFLNLLDLSI